ncbi:SH3 domain-containing protein [Treponema sp. Marseille-Q3903]|uniref:SH3 domain-containing protein n=1 Tax=Treponema sp. Marseille-Q3903 TaxID=2766703 RepID=UPI00165201E8|nr:SH3 domain-containing protein [Treponema sp. Marseille-Q3903]MBC6714038.1 SH3 domain-containing protein [Treponema sp. Marseille-Q3903]
MKKNNILIFLIVCIFFNGKVIANGVNIQDFLLNETITIGLRFNEKSDNLAGVIHFDKGHVSSSGNGTFSIIINPDYLIKGDYLEIYYTRCFAQNFFDENRSYFRWSFPERLKVNVSVEDLMKAKNSWNHFTRVSIDTSQTYPITCQAIIIDDLNVRDEPSLEGKKIGTLKKRDEVTLYEQRKTFDEKIDGEKNPWYKVKISENQYGWIYGYYVRIFFEDENLGYSDKEKILESIEN